MTHLFEWYFLVITIYLILCKYILITFCATFARDFRKIFLKFWKWFYLFVYFPSVASEKCLNRFLCDLIQKVYEFLKQIQTNHFETLLDLIYTDVLYLWFSFLLLHYIFLCSIMDLRYIYDQYLLQGV